MTHPTVERGLERETCARVLMPEQRLALAVLADAVAAFQRHALALGAEFAETREWLFSDDTGWPFAFLNVCAALGLEPRYIRSGLAAWLSRAHAHGVAGTPVASLHTRRAHARRGGSARRRSHIVRCGPAIGPTISDR